LEAVERNRWKGDVKEGSKGGSFQMFLNSAEINQALLPDEMGLLGIV
jgi:hypothetical protein